MSNVNAPYTLPNIRFNEHHACCINLERRVDRWQAFCDSWRAAGLTGAPRRFRAVEPLPREVPGGFRGNVGAWGCLASHVALYQNHLAALASTPLVIFEDDAQFVPQFAARFGAFARDLPADWQLAYLGGNHHFYGAEWPTPLTPRVARCRRTLTTHAYALRSAAMELVLSLPRTDPIDVLLCAVQQRLPCYCATPDLVLQAAGPSDICGGAVDYGPIWAAQRAVFAEALTT